MGLKYYALRVGCFGALLSFTFVFPILPVVILSGIGLGVLFLQDFVWKAPSV